LRNPVHSAKGFAVRGHRDRRMHQIHPLPALGRHAIHEPTVRDIVGEHLQAVERAEILIARIDHLDVLGANLGTAINPLLESGVHGDPAGRRLPVGNLVNRIVGVALALAALNWIGPKLVTFDPDPGRAVADFHTGFNVIMALLFFPVLKPLARLLARLLPVRVDAADPSQPVYLDGAAREKPTIALAGAAREALRMVDVFEEMLRGAIDSLDRDDRKLVSETKRMDDVLDRLDRAVKEYLTSLDTDALDDADHSRMLGIIAFTTNIEHAGDIVERSLLPLAAKRIKQGIAFSETSRRKIREMIERLVSNARAAAAVFMTEDPRSARKLIHEKEVFREFETNATTAHFGRVRAGRKDSVEAGRLHLDIVRDLKAGQLALGCCGLSDPRRPE
jgi:phosphate:Na+ symporter